MPSSKTSVPVTRPSEKAQYHHFIPRFILRRFQVDGPLFKNKKERNKAFRKRNPRQESVLFYDLATGTLESRPIGVVYGVEDLYKDVKDSEIYYVEKQLAVLETEAAHIIDNLHKSLHTRRFRIQRAQLNQLRKFMFLMHYRHPRLSVTYWQEDHPENKPNRPWIAKYRERHGLESAGAVWLHILRYYIDTPHQQILLHAEQDTEPSNSMAQLMKLSGEADPNDEYFHAIAYQIQANMYFLSIWEAAEGEEFVLGENSFGLWEGLMDGENGLHRLFVVSPKVVIVLRLNFLRPELYASLPSELRATSKSNLLDIICTAAQCHRSSPLPPGLSPSEALQQYRSSAAALTDIFHFDVIKLTSSQTYAVNAVTMLNVHDMGITFSSRECMLRTVRLYAVSILNKNRAKFSPLLAQLEPKPTSVSVAPHKKQR